jgi:type I restriction enzyme M protein
MTQDILKYESKVWATADLLIGAGIKQSDFPTFMMPFFALMMVESRLLRMKEELQSDDIADDILLELIQNEDKGYNTYLFEHKKQLKDICLNDNTFSEDFEEYLNGFDEETKLLLGVNKTNSKVNYLNMSGQISALEEKRILQNFTKEWSSIDLQPFNNSEITTLEEHIKRKWADVSAETAGEQYTPDDVISLISEIIASKPMNRDKFVTIYDPTCGGGNMVYGVEDRIRENFDIQPATYGQDFNQVLYALAKIESRFRGDDSYIEYGNTLTHDKFASLSFDYIVANPPYGTPWKTFSKDIYNDETNRFTYHPAVSDGQMLFLQHIVSKINLNGMGVVVLNGSSLFSGDAGSGESNIRKMLFDADRVEAIIQLPTDEFFNTGIFTYLWVLNKNKKKEHKNKVIMINASEKFTPMKKNKGKKRKRVDELNRIDIVKTLVDFKDNDYAKVFSKEYFYFNKQALMLTNLDYKDNYLKLEENKKSIKLKPLKILQDDILIDKFEDFNVTLDFTKELIKELDYKEKDLKVYISQTQYYFYDEEKETIIKQDGEIQEELGCGKIIIKATYKKATKKTKIKEAKNAYVLITVELTPDYQKDYEIITFDKDNEQNQKNIDDFMKKYITKLFVLLNNTVGVEINFNKIFYKPEKLRALELILSDIKNINNELKILEDSLGL